MTGLSEFLLARIAEDETECRQEIADGYGGDQHESGWSSNRVLAECEAKRRIVELHSSGAHPDGFQVCNWDNYVAPCETLTVLALPYADHPDYDPEWKP